MVPGHLAQVLGHFRGWPRFLVAARVAQRVEHVGHRHDARIRVDVLPAQSLRIAGAVEFFVVLVRDDRRRLQDRALRAVQDLQPHGRVLFHDGPLGVSQLAGLEQHRIGRGDLADVVHRRGVHQHCRLVFGHARRLGQHVADLGHAAHVVARLVRARFDDVAQAQDQLGLGIGDFLVQQNIVERDGHARAEHLEHLRIDVRNLVHTLEHQERRLAAVVREVADIGVAVQARDAVVARVVQLRHQFRADLVALHVADLGQHFVLALAGDHAGRLQAQQHALFQAQQGHDLQQQAIGEVLEVALLEDVGGRGDHAFQALAVGLLDAARFLDLHDVAVGAQRGERRRKQLGAIELGLFLVVVDVVIDDHALFRRLAGLAGTQHDAGELVVQVLAHPARHFQATVFALHHHVEEHQCDVLLARQDFLGFGAAVGMYEGERTAIEAKARQGQLRDVVDIGLVVYQQDFPGCEFGRSGRQEGHGRFRFVGRPGLSEQTIFSQQK